MENNFMLRNGFRDNDFSNDLELAYVKHLRTEVLLGNGKIRMPGQLSMVKSMLVEHNKNKQTANASSIVEEHVKDGGNLFFWSDQHFFHKNIIEYSNRPFSCVEEMNNCLIEKYMDTVADNDMVIFGGDISFGSVSKTKEMLNGLPGKKILVMGNHDFNQKSELIEYGCFVTTVMIFSLNAFVDGLDKNFVVSHYPIRDSFLPENSINIHGHIHEKVIGGKHINVSVENTDYAPIKIF